MAQKRAVGGPRKNVKAQKTENIEVDEATGSVLELVDYLAELPADCREMLKFTVPLALGGERHALQQKLIVEFNQIRADAGEMRRASVSELEGRIVSHKASRDTTKLESAQHSANEATIAKEQAISAQDDADTELQNALANVENLKEKVKEVNVSVQGSISSKVAFETVWVETWNAVKNCEFAPKDWRARQRAIGRIVDLLGQCQAPKSLLAGLALALKEKPDVRTQFANLAVEHCETHVQDCFSRLESQIEGLKKEAETAEGNANEADELATAKRNMFDAAQESRINFENAWVDASEVVRLEKQALKTSGEELQLFEEELVERKRDLDHFIKLNEAFTLIHAPDSEIAK